MTLHLEPVPGGFYDQDDGWCIQYDLGYLVSADDYTMDIALGFEPSLRADVLVVAEEEAYVPE